MFVRPVISDEYSCSHLLGLYIGDGRLESTSRGHQLRFDFDAAYPGIVDDAEASMTLLTMGRPVRRRVGPGPSGTIIDTTWTGWPALLPRAGPGRGNERPTALAPWQQAIVDREPEAFLRGLIESDGCRVINRFKTRLPSGRVAAYAYPRYFFSNPSADIRGLFCASCERIGVRWTQSNPRNISVAHHDSVARLDTFVGPKA